MGGCIFEWLAPACTHAPGQLMAQPLPAEGPRPPSPGASAQHRRQPAGLWCGAPDGAGGALRRDLPPGQLRLRHGGGPADCQRVPVHAGLCAACMCSPGLLAVAPRGARCCHGCLGVLEPLPPARVCLPILPLLHFGQPFVVTSLVHWQNRGPAVAPAQQAHLRLCCSCWMRPPRCWSA